LNALLFPATTGLITSFIISHEISAFWIGPHEVGGKGGSHEPVTGLFAQWECSFRRLAMGPGIKDQE